MKRDFRVASIDTIEIEGGISALTAFSDLLRASIGTGLLALPYAFRCAGYIGGIVGCIIVGWVTYYLIRLMYYNMMKYSQEEGNMTFTMGETLRLSLERGPNCTKKCAPHATRIVQVCIVLFQLSVSCVYYLFIAKNLKQFIDWVAQEDISTWICLIALFIPCILLNYIRNFKIITPFAHIGNILTLIVYGCLVYFLSIDIPSLDTRSAFGDYQYYPTFYGLACFSFCTIGVFMKLIEKMKHPRDMIKFCGVLDITIIILTIVYSSIGFFGYLKYGEETLGSITLNLPLDNWISQTTKLLTALSVIFAYPLHAYVLLDIVLNEMIFPKLGDDISKFKYYGIEFCVRGGLAVINLSLSFMIPELGIMTAIAGAALLTVLAVLMPAFIDYCRITYNKKYGPIRLWLILDIFFLIYGVIMVITGVGQPISDLVIRYVAGNVSTVWSD